MNARGMPRHQQAFKFFRGRGLSFSDKYNFVAVLKGMI
jgi:hypothetical protein